MKKKSLLITILLLISIVAFSLTACNNAVSTLETLKNEYGIVVDGGGFKEGSTLVSNEIVATTEEAAEVLTAIADQNYNKDGSVFIFDIYVTKDGVKVQPNGKVTVSVPIPNVEIDNYLVFHVKADNSVEKLIPTVANGKISFETSSFSYFVIAEDAPAEHEHNYESVVTPPTCTQDGYTTYTCACGDSYVGNTVTAPGHTYVDGECECGADDPNYTPPHVHSYTWVEGKASTCKEEGIASHYNCEGCGKNFDENKSEIASVLLPIGSHEYGSMYWGKSANFWEEGNIEYCQCSVCEKYFDNEYNEVKTPVIPKYSTNLSICVNGKPTALTLDEQNESYIIWSIKGLSVVKGDVITICQTDNAEFSHNYFADGNVDTYGKILTTAAAANVVLTATPNGLMLFIDGYKYEGIVIEINGEQYPMNFVTYPSGEESSYVYGYVNFAVGDKFVIIDNVSGTVYDYDDLAEELLWNTWDFYRGDNGEFVIDFSARYGIEFDNNGNKKIYISKAFAPYDGESFGMVFEGDREDELFDSMELPTGDDVDNEFMWTLTHCTTMNNADFIEYINKNGLIFCYTIIDIEAGEKFSLKNFTTGEFIGADYLVDITGDITAVTREGDLVSVQKSGSFYIIYLPAFNSFTIECDTSDPLAEINLYAGDKAVTLIPDENGDIFYEGFESKTYNLIALDDARYSSLPIILDESMDKTLVDLTISGDTYSVYPTKEGIYNLRYNVYTNVLYLEYVGEESGSDEEPTVEYLYSLITTNGNSDNQTVSMHVNPTNSKEFYCQGVSIKANYFISVMEIAKDGSSSNTYGALADTDASIAQSYGTLAMVKIAGTYDVYFDTVKKTLRLIPASSSTDQVLPKEIYISDEKTYTLVESPENADELCYLGIVLESYDSFRIRDTNNSFIADITLAEGTAHADTSGAAVMVEKGGIYNFYINKATHEVRIELATGGDCEEGACVYDKGVVTKEPTHIEEGVKTFTCTICGRTRTESIEKTSGHSFGNYMPDEVDETKHYKQCACGEKESADCTFEDGICTVCGREKPEDVDGIIIVISKGTANFEGKDTVATYSNNYGENANVYIAQENDVLNVTLTDQGERTFKYWVSATGAIIPDEDFSILVFRSGYYYPVFEDTDMNSFSSRVKIGDGNCEEGVLYMSTNSKGDIKYELEFVNYGRHDFAEYANYNNQYHKQECSICGESIFEPHTDYTRETEKEPTHTEEGIRRYECFCGYVWRDSIPATDEHSVDYDDWHIVEESKNGQYGKYRVYCKYCDYYEEYWYLGGFDFVSFIDGKMINYQYTYGGKVSHDEYYYSYRNAEGKKVYIWAFQYEYEYASNADYNDTYIFMYIDDENSATIEPVYLSKSRGDRKAEYLWAIYGYAYDVNGWIDLLDYPDRNIGCNGGMSMGNSMSARSSVLEVYHDQWADTYNKLRIPTSKAYNDLSDTEWELYHEGEAFGGRAVISYVKDIGTSLQKYFYVDKATGITYGYEDFGTAYRTTFIMRTYKTIVSPEEFEALDDDGKLVSYSYGNIEQDIKSLCAKRMAFNNFTLTVPQEASAFRLSVDFLIDDLVDLGGYYSSVYYNTAQVFDGGSYITFSWLGEDGLVFDCYEIWDFVNQKWVVLSESPEFTFNSSDNPRRDAAYVRVVYHKVDVPAEPSERYTITIENGYFEIDGKEYTGTVEVPFNTIVYPYANEVAGKTFDHWLDGNGEEFYDYYFYVTSDMTLSPVYTDTIYNVYCSGWNYDSYVSVNGGEMHYSNEFEGKAGDTFELNTTYNPEYGCNVFIGWYLESYGPNGHEYIFISDSQTFTYEITGDEYGSLYAVWTTGDNPMIKKFVDIKVINGFVSYSGGEGGDVEGFMRDNAYSAISVSNMGNVTFFDDPTDETVYTAWDVAYRYELDGEMAHDTVESFEDEYDYYPARYWIDDPQYNYPDGLISVTAITVSNDNVEDGVEEI